MLDDRLRTEMIFYATTNDYSDAGRYERFAFDCKLDEKAADIGRVVRELIDHMPYPDKRVEILETASATGLTAAGVTAELMEEGVEHGYTSLDIEPNLLGYAKARKRGRRFVCGDFERLPFGNDSFDIYIMMGAEGYRPRGSFYPEVYRVLRQGGYYVMPQIGPRPQVSEAEKNDALRAGLCIARADNYLIAQKI